MGTDIHLYVELKHEVDGREDGEWVLAMSEEATYRRRWSPTFAVLSGLDAKDFGVIPIAPARGLPDDVSVEVARRAARQVRGAHTHSWLTLAEVLAYSWPDSAPRHFLDWAASIQSSAHAMWTTLSLYPPDEIRFVFWFDN